MIGFGKFPRRLLILESPAEVEMFSKFIDLVVFLRLLTCLAEGRAAESFRSQSSLGEFLGRLCLDRYEFASWFSSRWAFWGTLSSTSGFV